MPHKSPIDAKRCDGQTQIKFEIVEQFALTVKQFVGDLLSSNSVT